MRTTYRGRLARKFITGGRDARGTLQLLCALALLFACELFAATAEPPPDPGFEASVKAADVIADVEIISGGPFRAVALVKKLIKGEAPKLFELEGYNSYNWDTVHQGFSAGGRFILFLSRTGSPDVFATLTPSAPRLSVQQDGVLIALGDPPFRIPVRRAALEEGLALLLEANGSGKVPERAAAFLSRLWDDGEIESRYFAVAIAGALKDGRAAQLLIDASRDKLLKLRLTALEALGKVGTPQTIAALRALLKDERATVTREAARILVEIREIDALPELLEWARKTLSATATAAVSRTGKTDQNRVKTEAITSEIIRFAGDYGMLLEAGALARPLLELAQLGGDNWPREALQAYVKLAQAEQIPALLEAADDRTWDLYRTAISGLEQHALRPVDKLDDFRKWWTSQKENFGEEQRREAVEAAAKKLLTVEFGDDKRAMMDVIRRAPGDIALVSAAPLLLNPKTFEYFSADDLASWRTPLALPFLIERLGRDDLSERRAALSAIIAIAARQPRLKAALWPLLRAALADDDGSLRRVAEVSAGSLAQPEALNALLDAMQYQGGYEAQDAGKALYAFSARTLGFSYFEPAQDQTAAVKRLRGWHNTATGKVAPLKPGSQLQPRAIWTDLDTAARTQRFETLLQNADSRVSAAAYEVLLAERAAADPLWKKMLAQKRQRDRAYALVAVLGGEPATILELGQRLPGVEGGTEAPLGQALAIMTLAASKGGAEKVAAWLQTGGSKAELPWRRLAILSLGLADNDPRSLACLDALLEISLEAKPPSRDGFEIEKPSDEFMLLRPVVFALCARTDSTSLLMKALENCKDRPLTESIARALSQRRHKAAVPALLAALQRSDRYTWNNLARALQPLLQPGDAAGVRKLLDCAETTARAAGAYLLAMLPQLTDGDTVAQLALALTDESNVVRYFSATALGKRKAKDAVRKLVNALDDEDDDVRAAAAEALGAIGDADACTTAAKASQREVRIDTRWLRALAVAGGNAQMELLLRLCNSTSYIEQRAGLEALGASARPDALERIVKTYANDEAALQTVAADVLAQRDDAIEILSKELAAKDIAVRARALHTLARVNTAASRQILVKAAKEETDAALRALAEFGLKRADRK